MRVNALGLQRFRVEVMALGSRIRWPVSAMRFKCTLKDAKARRYRLTMPTNALGLWRFRVEATAMGSRVRWLVTV